jgi:hypothetical protein
VQKLSIKQLILFENKYSLWDYKLFGYPLWIHCREPLLESAIMAERKMPKVQISVMFKSFVQTVKFLFSQKKYDNVYFLMERAELLEIYSQDKSVKKLLFLNPEQEKIYEDDDYISSDFFSLLRFISRKIAFILFWKRYKEVSKAFSFIDDSGSLTPYIKVALGDALFLKFLSFVLDKKSKKFYTGAVIPMGEKFINALNSYEVQHGVIHPSHTGYVGLPEVKNSLILYSKRYEHVLKENGYRGNFIVQDYKKTFFEKKVERNFFILIYTQPDENMQQGINNFFKKYKPSDVFIQKHPKDYYDYNIEEKYFVNATTPFEVKYPIFFTSSVMENFTIYDKKCYIYDLKYPSFNLIEFLNIYTRGSSSEVIILESLDEIYRDIKENEK